MEIKPTEIFCRHNNGFSKIKWQTLALFRYFQMKDLRHSPIQIRVTLDYRLITNRKNHKILWLFPHTELLESCSSMWLHVENCSV
jgi:hypothetical protein